MSKSNRFFSFALDLTRKSERGYIIIDTVVPADVRVGEVEKYQDF